MNNKLAYRFPFTNPVSLLVLSIAVSTTFTLLSSQILAADTQPQTAQNSTVQVGHSYHNDVSGPLRDIPSIWPPRPSKDREDEFAREARRNPKIPLVHVDEPDPVVDRGIPGPYVPEAMPATILNFDGILFPGVNCFCNPPDTDGAVGASQYVQIVNEGYQVFNKATGGSVLGPIGIASIWSGFGGNCQVNTLGDPIVLYDRIANRWLISQFAGAGGNPTDECIAVSTTSDATGSYFRYAFNLGTNLIDYPKFGVWPDGYYMALIIFNSSGTAYLGPQPFVFNRAAMLTGAAASFISPVGPLGATEAPFLPADFEGTILPTAGAPNPYVSFPFSGAYKVWAFHADFVTPVNSTFINTANPAAAGFASLCPGTRDCVPQLGTAQMVDGIGDRLMFRLAYRKFGDGHESVVGNYSVSSGGVAGIRWFELRAITVAPFVFQQSTYQPDSTWRWMGSAAMDKDGDLAIGFSASSSSINPQIRYAGRLASDPVNTLSQGEATLFAGTGSQTGDNRWGDYSAMTVDPVDDCTFWYTNEYYSTTGGTWRTRIGNFKFPSCVAASPTPTPSPIPTPTPTPTPSLIVTVSLPVANVSTAVTNFVANVTTSAISGADNLVGFQGDFTFDSSVVTFQSTPASGAGLTGTNWNVSANVIGGGTIKTLRVSAFSNDFTPLSGSGTLFQLNMTRVSSTSGATTPLTWAAPPGEFYFIDADLNNREPNSTPPGSMTIVTPLAVTVNLPVTSVDTATTNFTANVTTTAISGSDNLVGFQGDFTFDSSIVTFQTTPISGAGLTSTNWNVTGNVLGAGTIKTLRISAFSNDFTPLSGSGTLFQLNMTRVSSTVGANTALTWAPPPGEFYFIDQDINNRVPDNTPPGSVTIIAANVSISGTITYCSNATNPAVPNATLTLTGTSSGSTTTNGSGNYTLASIPAGGNYTVTPSKAALTPASVGINTVDVIAIQRHFLGLGVPLSGCRLTAADVNGVSGVNTVDVIAVQRFFLGLATGIANVGRYQFNPVTRTYTGLVTNQTAQNYAALIFGDVASAFVH